VKALAGLLSGAVFGFGLALSGMTDTNKVLGFLDFFGAWDPALIFVMGAAVAVTLIGFPLVRRRTGPLFDTMFHIPLRRAVDARLLLGAAIFGAGWGLYGYCPGPALTALYYGADDTLLFLLAMIGGMFIASRLPER
jgi:uncharacterized membrane protein YedE/YeeE